MKAYQDILRNVLEKGTPKQPVRFDSEGNPVPVENGTIGTFCEVFRHDMSEGFPLLTTKKMAFKTMCVELEGFIQGITDKNWYKERKCRIWNEWANPLAVKEVLESHGPELEKKEVQAQLNDLGPIYGYQWRNFDQQYGDTTLTTVGPPNAGGEYQMVELNRNGVDKGFDQLKSIADKLKENPYDRRMICSAWNPNQLHMMALPACHLMFNVVVYGDKLNLVWNQRSCDLFLGVPFNIASYAILLLLLAKHAGLEPGELVGTLHDCHLYENQIEQAKIQLKRTPLKLPTVRLTHNGDIFDWTHEDIVLDNYACHDRIAAEVTV